MRETRTISTVIFAVFASLLTQADNLSGLRYRRGAETLSEFNITNDRVGRRTALDILPAGDKR